MRSAPTVTGIRASIQAGDHLSAYDDIVFALEAGLDSAELKYLHVLTLCNLGFTDDAVNHYRSYRLSEQLDEDCLALGGRLLKDQYIHAPSTEHLDLARRSAEAYENAARMTAGYYSAINAATMYKLAGVDAASHQWATETIRRLAAAPTSGNDSRFFYLATGVEAHALLSERNEAETCLKELLAISPAQPHWLARLRSQLSLLERQGCLSFAIAHRIVINPIGVLIRAPKDQAGHAGHIAVRPRLSKAYVLVDHPDAAAAALRLAASGVSVHALFLGPRAVFLDATTQGHGEEGHAVVSECLGAVDAVTEIPAFVERDSPVAKRYAADLCMGAGRHDADELGTQLECVDLATGLTSSMPAATPTSPATEKQFCASVLFADFQGFSKLSHHQVRQFSDTVLRSMGDVLDKNSPSVLLRRSWGDAVHAICTDVASGLELAFGFQAACDSDSDNDPRLAPRLRVALHFGPMEHAYDAVEKRPTIFGAGLTFAARIEPITPPGSVLVSEAVVSEAALRGEKRFYFDYAGKLELAKGYGRHRMFLARRATTSRVRHIH